MNDHVLPRLARIVIYPIKSLEGVEVETAEILPSGSLVHDRRWSLVDPSGEWINGKREPGLHRIRATYQLHESVVQLKTANGPAGEFHLGSEAHRLQTWLSQALGRDVLLRENAAGGFPDDAENHGPTVVSTPTLAAVSGWFAGLTLDDIRQRFRANLEIGTPSSAGDFAGDPLPAFWEDRLVGPAGTNIAFSIGDSHWLGTNPCQRCAVPTRHAQTGEVWTGFAKLFAENRLASLPGWAARERFDHGYRLTVNTVYVGGGQHIRVGDPILLHQ